MLLFLIKHTFLFVWVLSQRINVNEFSKAVYHCPKVKLGIKGPTDLTIAGLVQATGGAALRFIMVQVKCDDEAMLRLNISYTNIYSFPAGGILLFTTFLLGVRN